MRKAAELAKPQRGFFKSNTGESVRVGAVGGNAKPVEESAPDQMWRPTGHDADTKVHTGFAKIYREQLRMGVGHVQNARIAETFEIVDAGVVRATRSARQRSRKRDRARSLQQIAAA